MRSRRSCSPRPWRPGRCACARAGPRAARAPRAPRRARWRSPVGQLVDRVLVGETVGVDGAHEDGDAIALREADGLASRDDAQPADDAGAFGLAGEQFGPREPTRVLDDLRPGGDVARDETQQALVVGAVERLLIAVRHGSRCLRSGGGHAASFLVTRRRGAPLERRPASSGAAPTGVIRTGRPIGLRGGAACGRGVTPAPSGCAFRATQLCASAAVASRPRVVSQTSAAWAACARSSMVRPRAARRASLASSTPTPWA